MTKERVAELLTVTPTLGVNIEGVGWGEPVVTAFVHVGKNPEGVGAIRLSDGPTEGE